MKNVLSAIVVATVLSAPLFLCAARADTIASWGFEANNQSSPVTGTNSSVLSPDVGPPGSLGWGTHASASSSFSDVTGNGSTHALSTDHWGIGDYYEFQTSTLGFTNISVSFDQFRSGTGPTNWDFKYSTDGSTFFTALAYSVTNTPAWSSSTYRSAYTLSVDLASLTALANDADVYFRLVASSAASSTAGASRVDNFIVLGEPVPEPATVALWGMSAGLLLLVRRRTQR